jgi:hypothetical protein
VIARAMPFLIARSARGVLRPAATSFVVVRGRKGVSAPSSSPRRRAKRHERSQFLVQCRCAN